MSVPPPSYLRLLHCDDIESSDSASGAVAVVIDDRDIDDSRDDSTALSHCQPIHSSNLACDESDPTLESFWRTYRETTGWRIDPAFPSLASRDLDTMPTETPSPSVIGSPKSVTDPAKVVSESASMADLSGRCPSERVAESVSPRVGVMDEANARQLAEAAQRLADQLRQQQEQLRAQHVELAARAAVIAEPSRQRRTGDRIERILADATMATRTDAAAVYLLDDETEMLTARFVFGMSPLQRLGKTRPLRGARGDLEAMIQGVVLIDELKTEPIDQYRSPEAFAAGICVCLGDTDLPIGTFWLFRSEKGQFGERDAAAARLAADSLCQTLLNAADASPARLPQLLTVVKPELAPETKETSGSDEQSNTPSGAAADSGRAESVQLESDAAESIAAESIAAESIAPIRKSRADDLDLRRYHEWVSQISEWQYETMPIGHQLVPGWKVDAIVESPLPIAQSWHWWDLLPNGLICLAICRTASRWDSRMDLSSVLDATLARAATQAHARYRHSPTEAISRICGTLVPIHDGFINESGRLDLNLFYAHIDPSSGAVEIASIGDWSALAVSSFGYRAIGPCHSADRSVREHWPESFEEAIAPKQVQVRLQPGEVMVVTDDAWMGLSDSEFLADLPQPQQNESAQHRVGAAIRKAIGEGDTSALSAVRRMMADVPMHCERAAVSVTRQSNA